MGAAADDGVEICGKGEKKEKKEETVSIYAGLVLCSRKNASPLPPLIFPGPVVRLTAEGWRRSACPVSRRRCYAEP